jgi:hypothetical protein
MTKTLNQFFFFPPPKSEYFFQFTAHFLCHVLAAILKMADISKILKMQNCSSNGDLSLCQILCLYHYPFRINTRVRIFIFFVAQFFPEFNIIWQKLWISFFFFLHQNQNIFFSNICLEKNPLQVKLWRPFWKWWSVEIFHNVGTLLSTHISNFDDIGQCWIFAVLWWPFWKWQPVEIFQWPTLKNY